MVWVASLALLSTSAGACTGTVELAALTTALQQAEEALSVLDIAGFKAAATQADDLLACVGEPVPRHVAAQLHRMVGLRAFGERDPSASGAFAAARQIEPAYSFPRSLVPKGSPVFDAWSAIPLDAITTTPIPPPAEGWIELDGRSGAARADTLPAVFQRFDGDGAVAASGYLSPQEPLPPYVVALPGAVPTSMAPTETPHLWRRARVPLAIVSSGSAVVGGTLWGLSVQGRARYLNTDDPVADDDLAALRSRTNALAAGSIVGAGLASISGVLLLTTW